MFTCAPPTTGLLKHLIPLSPDVLLFQPPPNQYVHSAASIHLSGYLPTVLSSPLWVHTTISYHSLYSNTITTCSRYPYDAQLLAVIASVTSISSIWPLLLHSQHYHLRHDLMPFTTHPDRKSKGHRNWIYRNMISFNCVSFGDTTLTIRRLSQLR